MAFNCVKARRMGRADRIGKCPVGPQKAEIGGKPRHPSHSKSTAVMMARASSAM
jgi:hypothetical protein